jgi:hypothetical protein
MVRNTPNGNIETMSLLLEMTDMTDEEAVEMLGNMEDFINHLVPEHGHIEYMIHNDDSIYVKFVPRNASLDIVLAEFERGYDENEWEWRSAESLSNQTHIPVTELTEILQDTNLFVRSSNGLKYRVTLLETESQ